MSKTVRNGIIVTATGVLLTLGITITSAALSDIAKLKTRADLSEQSYKAKISEIHQSIDSMESKIDDIHWYLIENNDTIKRK